MNDASDPGSGATTDLERPRPATGSLLGAVAGALLVVSLFAFLSEIDGDQRRVMGLLLSLGFEVIGVVILKLAGSRRMATVGVTLSAVGVVPLVFHLFVDTGAEDGGISTVGDLTSTTTSVLVVLALLWGAAYLVGPGRRYSIFLAGALVALWLVAVVQIVGDTLDDVVSSSFSVVGSSTTDEYVPIDPFETNYGEDVDSSYYDEDGGYYDTGDDYYDDDITYYGGTDVDQPWTRIGVMSLLFGGAYLAVAGRRDQRGDRRMATPLFAAAIPILHVATFSLSNDLEAGGTGLLAIGLGGVAIWLGSRGGRRFTAWTGVWAVTVGALVLASEITGDNTPAFATLLLVAGLGLAGGLYAADGGPQTPWPPTPTAAGPMPDPAGPPNPGALPSGPWPAAQDPTAPDRPWPASPPEAPPAAPGPEATPEP